MWDVVTCVRADTVNFPINVTHSDKMGTQSLGRSRDNWKKHHLGVINFLNLLLFMIFFPRCMHGVFSITFLLLSASPLWPIHDLKTHFESQTAYFWLKQCQSFQLHFLEMVTLLLLLIIIIKFIYIAPAHTSISLLQAHYKMN